MRAKIINSLIIAFTGAVLSVTAWQYGAAKYSFYGDAIGYYSYLPSLFIYHNIREPWNIPEKDVYWVALWSLGEMKKITPAGQPFLDKYTYGTALMEAPFFFAGRIYAHFAHKPINGYASVYDNMVKTSTLVYALLGCLLLYFILRRYFSATTALLCLSATLLCTNLLWFTIYQAGMAHVPLFFLYAALMYATVQSYEKPAPRYFLLIGFLTGLITLIRPSDALCVLIPMLYGIRQWHDAKNRIAFARRQWKMMALALSAFMVPFIPQLIYWKLITGNFLCYSYGSESFDFRHPKIIEGLFYCANGWLPYAPVMFFALLGMFLYTKLKDWMWCIVITLPLYVYVIYSWYCFNYINGLGSRPMIHMYPLLALPLAAFIEYVSGKHLAAKAALLAVCFFFLAVNISFSELQQKGLLNSEESNFAFDREILFHQKLTMENLYTRDLGETQPDTTRLERLKTLVFRDYEDGNAPSVVRDPSGKSKYCYHMHDTDYLLVASVKYDKKLFSGAKWFRVSGRFMCTQQPDYFRHLLIVTVNDQSRYWRGCTIENKILDTPAGQNPGNIALKGGVLNKWGTITYFSRIPGFLKNGDDIKLVLWIRTKTEMYADDLSLELYH